MPTCAKCKCDGQGGNIIRDKYYCVECSKKNTGNIELEEREEAD